MRIRVCAYTDCEFDHSTSTIFPEATMRSTILPYLLLLPIIFHIGCERHFITEIQEVIKEIVIVHLPLEDVSLQLYPESQTTLRASLDITFVSVASIDSAWVFFYHDNEKDSAALLPSDIDDKLYQARFEHAFSDQIIYVFNSRIHSGNTTYITESQSYLHQYRNELDRIKIASLETSGTLREFSFTPDCSKLFFLESDYTQPSPILKECNLQNGSVTAIENATEYQSKIRAYSANQIITLFPLDHPTDSIKVCLYDFTTQETELLAYIDRNHGRISQVVNDRISFRKGFGDTDVDSVYVLNLSNRIFNAFDLGYSYFHEDVYTYFQCGSHFYDFDTNTFVDKEAYPYFAPQILDVENDILIGVEYAPMTPFSIYNGLRIFEGSQSVFRENFKERGLTNFVFFPQKKVLYFYQKMNRQVDYRDHLDGHYLYNFGDWSYRLVENSDQRHPRLSVPCGDDAFYQLQYLRDDDVWCIYRIQIQ